MATMDIDEAIDMLEEIYGCFDLDGISSDSLDASTRHVAAHLPPALRTLYLRTGRSIRLHQCHNQLVAPSDLAVTATHLIFYRENQSVCSWGIPLDRLDNNPPVDVITSLPRSSWRRAFEHLSHFVAIEGAWQAIHGGLQATALVTGITPAGWVRDSSTRLERFVAACARDAHKRIEAGGSTVWTHSKCILVAEGSGAFGLGAPDEETLLAVSEALGMSLDDWDYASGRDRAAN